MISVDPGLRHCGVAVWFDRRLIRAGLVTNSMIAGRGPVAHKLMAQSVIQYVFPNGQTEYVLEYPRIYPKGAQRKGDLNDLLDLAGVDGAIAALAQGAVQFVYPADWKGQIPKKIMNDRVWGVLTTSERIVCQSKDHNILDAVGIGLHALGRLR